MLKLRQKAFTLWCAVTLGIVGTSHLPLFLISRRWANLAPRNWARLVRFGLKHILETTTEVRGLDRLPKGPVLVAMKHHCAYDTVLPFLWFEAPCFVLKQELLKTPVFGWYARHLGLIPIDRDGGMQALKIMLKAARAAADQGRPIVIFPEGTRQPVGAPPDYKPGVAALYRDLDLPCVVVALNTGVVWPPTGSDYRPGHIVFEVVETIPPGRSRGDFMRTLEHSLETAVDRLVQEGLAHQQQPRPLPNQSQRMLSGEA